MFKWLTKFFSKKAKIESYEEQQKRVCKAILSGEVRRGTTHRFFDAERAKMLDKRLVEYFRAKLLFIDTNQKFINKRVNKKIVVDALNSLIGNLFQVVSTFRKVNSSGPDRDFLETLYKELMKRSITGQEKPKEIMNVFIEHNELKRMKSIFIGR